MDFQTVEQKSAENYQFNNLWIVKKLGRMTPLRDRKRSVIFFYLSSEVLQNVFRV